jgi:2',3'-cyclic-nucleotide 2'-phosphodiesterase (5'-nucleotidase family)
LFAPTAVREIGGVTVGFVGVATPIVTQTMPHAFGAGLRIPDPAGPLRQAVRRLRHTERVDLVVAVSHMGLPQDIHLARTVEGIDVLLSGHTHDRLTHPIRVGKTLVMQSGFSGSFLGRLDLTVERGQVVDFRHQLITLDDSIPVDAAVQAAIDVALAPYRDRLAEVAGTLATPLHRMTVLEAPMDALITDAYVALTGADAAFSHGWRYGAPVPPGAITVGDLWQIIPTDPIVFTTELYGQEIRDVLEDSLESIFAADAMAQKGGYLIRTSGIRAQLRLNNPRGARVLALEIAGAPCDPARRYTVAGGGEQVLRAATKRPTGVHAIAALRQHLAQQSPLRLDVRPRFLAV